MDGCVDHVGVAVDEIDRALAVYSMLGFERMEEETVDSEGVRVVFLGGAGLTRLELLEPLHERSSLARFLSGRGEGLHHVAVRVNDIKAAVATCEEEGLTISGSIRTGALGRKVAFVHPKSASGVLIELVQAD
ncbi:MAG: methylmalonyl-CoA epimerase [Gemmatimonadota bacterium]|nr:methylmalonyl-CoA epimerase [Gemmatimonadota bacterium]